MTAPAADSASPETPEPPKLPAPPKALNPFEIVPLPGEPVPPNKVRVPDNFETTIPLAEPGGIDARAAKQAAAPAGTENRKATPVAQPKLAAKPMWEVAAEPGGRRFLGVMAMLVVVGLYAWFLSVYYSGAHGGVDQAGYLMTARLIAGDKTVDSPDTPAKPAAVSGPELPADKAPLIWAGGGKDYVAEVHPQPSGIQVSTRWNWLRNRLSFVPESPFEFASRMCVITEPYGPASPDLPAAGTRPAAPGKPAEYRVYAKYPFGYSLLAALGRQIDGMWDKKPGLMVKPAVVAQSTPATGPEATSKPAASGEAAVVTAATTAASKSQVVKFERAGQGVEGMYIVNPLCTVLACFFAYFMFRQAVSSFMALIGVIWLACNPLVLVYANDANSHASTLMMVCLGFWGVLSFLRTQQMWRAWIGGLALGYACTIRYSEFLLVLPVVFAAAIYFRPTWKRSMGSLSLLAAWAIPVAVLAFVCWISFGSPTKTGYTYCNEDTGFGWKYLTGNWEDRELTGNWETLVQQINRVGLFIMWPLALAGLCGMIGSLGRLGGGVALWDIPATFLYMLYYWAPGGDQTTGYLRFYVTVMPGYIFAGVWLMDRALAYLKGDKWAGLAIGTLLALFLLLVVAFFADGGPETIDGGLKKMIGGFITQTPSAVGHLFTHSWLGVGCASVIAVVIAGMWIFDRQIIAARMGLALAGGVITALGCAINLETIMPSVERNYNNETALRATVDNMREVLPRGSVVFADDGLLQQLDCVGGWKLYDTSIFSVAIYNQSMTKLAQKNTPERMDDPDPLQIERSQFYKELLTMPSSVATIGLGPRNQNDLMQIEKAVIERNLALGHRVTFLMVTDQGDVPGMGGGQGGFGGGGRAQIPEGFQIGVLRKWTVSAPPTEAVTGSAQTAFGIGGGGRGGGGGGRGGRGGRGGPGGGPGGGRGNNGGGIGGFLGLGGNQTPAAQANVTRQGPTYTLFEVSKPAKRLAALP